jgi:HEAT repeat protein
MGTDGVERIFNALDNETITANRLAIMRLLSRMGPAACASARKRLARPEWYVVRNACKLLGELKDPELLQHIGAAFLNKDERVQKAALQALTESRLPGRSAVLAAALPHLSPALTDAAFYELVYSAEPEALPPLEHCLGEALPSTLLTSVVQAIAAIQDAAAGPVLLRASRNEKLPPNVRAAAERAIKDRAVKRLVKNEQPEGANDADLRLDYAGA